MVLRLACSRRMRVMTLLLVLASCTRPAPATPTIDIDVKEMPIYDAVRLIATSAGVNLSLDPDIEGTVTLKLRAVPARVVLDAIARDHGLQVTESGKVLRISKASTPVAEKRFTGEPMALDVTDAPIRDVVAMIAGHAKVAIVVDDDVQASVTQRVKSLPWDQVLEHVARKHGLRVVRDGDTLRITLN